MPHVGSCKCSVCLHGPAPRYIGPSEEKRPEPEPDVVLQRATNVHFRYSSKPPPVWRDTAFSVTPVEPHQPWSFPWVRVPSLSRLPVSCAAQTCGWAVLAQLYTDTRSVAALTRLCVQRRSWAL